MSNTVMLIHGAWLTPPSWERLQSRYQEQGYRVLAPVGRIVDHHDRLIRALREPPILIGHSYGGLIVQKLLDRGLGASGVSLAGVPIRGLLLLGIGTGIHAPNPRRPPLLLIAGESDLTIPPAIVRATFARQRRSPSPTAYKSFPGRSHFLLAEPGWEEVADYAIDWATHHAWKAPHTAPSPERRSLE